MTFQACIKCWPYLPTTHSWTFNVHPVFKWICITRGVSLSPHSLDSFPIPIHSYVFNAKLFPPLTPSSFGESDEVPHVLCLACCSFGYANQIVNRWSYNMIWSKDLWYENMNLTQVFCNLAMIIISCYSKCLYTSYRSEIWLSIQTFLDSSAC
jgi:hypothetical protein